MEVSPREGLTEKREKRPSRKIYSQEIKMIFESEYLGRGSIG